jgi:hypothetical protein
MPAIRQTTKPGATKPGATKPGAIGNERVLVVISARIVCVGKSEISRNFAGGVAGRAASVYLGFAALDPHGRLFIRDNSLIDFASAGETAPSAQGRAAGTLVSGPGTAPGVAWRMIAAGSARWRCRPRPPIFPSVEIEAKDGAMAYLYQLAGRELAGRGIAAIAAVAFLGLAGCAPSDGSAIAEGSSSPPSVGSAYVYPPPDLQVYD